MNCLRVLATALLVAVALAGCGPSKPTGLANPGSNPQYVVRPDKPDYSLTAEDFSKEAFADPKAMEAKYKGKWVELTGTVGDANKTLHSTGFIMKGGKKDEKDHVGYIISVGLPQQDVGQAWLLAWGQKVKVLAYVSNFNPIIGGAILEQAKVTELEPSKLLTVKAEELAAEYAKDGEAAEKKYLGDEFRRDILISGTVADLIQEKAGGGQYVILAGSGKTGLKCWFLEDDGKMLKKGDKVTVKGELFRRGDGEHLTVHSTFLVKRD